jgi:hypothetical protein
VAEQLGIGEVGGEYAQFDDGNPVWEDEEFNSDDEDPEAIWRADDLASGFTIVKKSEQEIIRDVQVARSELAGRMKLIAFQTWQGKWRDDIISLDKKLLNLTRHGPNKLCPQIGSGKVPHYEPPHDYFTIGERAVWRNMMAWKPAPGDANREELMAGWITLPGPAHWWPHDYDYESCGFALPQQNIGQEEAFKLVLDRSWERTGKTPPLWDRVLPSDHELGVVSETVEGDVLLKLFDRLL